jgi:ABC-three component (ABC-3C) system Middle Component 3
VTAWPDRSPVRAAYLNPALVAGILAAAARSYESTAQQPMVWPMAFLVGPLVLHRPTRQALPKTTATHLSAWTSRNTLLRAGFPARAKALTPSVREGLRFGLRHGLLTVDGGALHGAPGSTRDKELTALLSSARLVGRWLAKTDQPATVFAILGVEP